MDSKHVPHIRLRRFLEELERRDTPTFAVLPPFTAGIATPTVVASADFNRDGFADVAVGNQFNSVNVPAVGIALGNGDGTFTAAKEILNPLMTGPRSMVVADFNGDGIPDLAIGSSDGGSPAFGSLLVYIGKGDGSFSGPTTQIPNPVQAIGAADFNGDGRPDIVAVYGDGLNVPAGYQVFLGNGDGTFAPTLAPQPQGIDGTRVATGDFDGDGLQDFIALDAVDRLMIPFFGDGTGQFVVPAPGFVPLNGIPTDIIAGDFDNNGSTDVIVAEDVGIIFIANLGARKFDPIGVALTNTPSGSAPTRLATADVNRDGLPDVIAVDPAQALVFTSNGGGSFTPDPNSPYSLPGVSTFVDVAAGDVNGDGVADFVATRETEDGTPSDGRVFLNLAPIPTVTLASAFPNPGVEGATIALTAAIQFTGKPFPFGTLPTGIVNFDADGQFLGSASVINDKATLPATFLAGPHVIVAHYLGDARFLPSDSQPLTVLVNPAPPTRTYQYEVTGLPTLPGLGADRVASGDFANDGVSDIVLGSGTGRPAQITVIDGKTRLTLFSELPFGPAFTGGVMVAAGDIDGDGVADLAVAADVGGGPRARVYLTRGDRLEPSVDFFALDPDFRGGLRIALGDVDGDGFADLVVTGGPGAGPRVATYDGQTLLPGMTPARLFNDFFAMDPDSRLGLFVAVGDLNGDGFGEIAVSSDVGGAPRVNIFDGGSLLLGLPVQVANFFAGNPDSRGGARIAIRDVSNDEGVEFIAGDGPGTGSTVRVFSGIEVYISPKPSSLIETELMPGFLGGVYVA